MFKDQPEDGLTVGLKHVAGIIIYMTYDIFINCNWVDTQWQ